MSYELVAQTNSNLDRLEQKIMRQYYLLLSDRVTSDLLLNHKVYKESPNKYWIFLNETFIDNWDFDATTKALVGSKIFESMTSLQFKELSRTVEATLIRYAFEGLSFYNEQKLNVIDIKVNEQQTLAWLKINMDSPRFPDIHLDLLLRRTNHTQWRGVDFSFKGITFVNLKKNSYRQDFEDLNFQGLLRKLYDKNKTFGKRKELAGKMRHSVMTAARNYLKVEDTPMNLRFEKLEKENADLKIENTKLKNELEQYKETEDAKILRRKKLNIIYTANIKKVEPKESTIKKYDLKKDEKGKYY